MAFHYTEDSRRPWRVDNPSGRIPATAQERWEHQQRWRDTPWPAEPKPASRLPRDWGGCSFSADETIARPTSHLRGLRYVPSQNGMPARIEPMRSEEPGRAAFEESGHAIAHDEHGWRVTSLCVREDGSGAAAGAPDLTTVPTAEKLRQKAAALWAGMMAQQRRYGNVVESVTDLKNIRMCARLLDLEGAAAEEFIESARKAAEQIVERRWADIVKVASILQVVRSMESRHFYKCIGKAEPKESATAVRKVQMPLQTRSLEVRSSSYDAAAKTVDVIWSSGASVKRYSWDGPYHEELAMEPANVRLDWLNSGKAPFLNSHMSGDTADVFGAVVAGSAYVQGGRGYAKVKLSSRAPLADIKSGLLKNVSVGYRVHKMEQRGKAADGSPIMVVTDHEPMEVSLVPLPADRNAEIRTFPAEVRG
jgi:hypothetical protein